MTDWTQATCARPELAALDWTPDQRVRRAAVLAAICRTCPLRTPCARLAVDYLEEVRDVRLVGVWAGVHLLRGHHRTEAQRRLYRIADLPIPERLEERMAG